MVCEHCGERPAAIHLTQIVNNTVTQQHLCETCAAEQGVHTEASVAKFPLSDFLASMGGEGGAPATPATDPGACGACGATLQDFQDTGRLGCPECYTTFAVHLRTLLRRVHGSSQHVGPPYVGPSASGVGDAPPPDLAALREQLKRAVEAENFELAARLRDQIRTRE